MNIAVIPARGGSKRIPGKNIKMFSGKPMIAYAIAAARSSGLFKHVIVSTDDDAIVRVAQDLGAEVPFRRPTNLADDHTPTVPVIAHAIEACASLGWKIDNVCCIYPAVPLIDVGDLRAALELLTASGAEYSFPVAAFPSAIQRALKLSSSGLVASYFPEFELVRTQDLEPAFHDAGQFYWGGRDAWLNNPRVHKSGAALVIPAWRVVDIDTPEDWVRAEMLHRAITSWTHPAQADQ
ncbi:pseudaminic acid cytidylyltransferase [Hyphomicrobium sp. xq]|uniref:Pseudaminic acid cytidylyltransferase n=1 Tax=Hyphomicrobium album TaxID=2665159 RepID=A0A6I3KK01_9HYPH|nr:pseudaminic acid cytidylyltransferase [Hyphomicrobium album]MTD94673.1 pseudaminic acid cytidylyltransferase [Hyphomicrobium album]